MAHLSRPSAVQWLATITLMATIVVIVIQAVTEAPTQLDGGSPIVCNVFGGCGGLSFYQTAAALLLLLVGIGLADRLFAASDE